MIKSLEIQGFKSFSKKIAIPVSNGFTAFVGPNGSGKSCAFFTEVLTSDGKTVSIGSIVNNALEKSKNIQKLDDGTYTTENPSNIKVLGLDPTSMKVIEKDIGAFIKREGEPFLYKIITRTGKEVTTTGCHPVMIFKDNEIKSEVANNLGAGDFIATPRTINFKKEKESGQIKFVISKATENPVVDVLPEKVNSLVRECAKLLNIKTGLSQKNFPEVMECIESKCCPTRIDLQEILAIFKKHLKKINVKNEIKQKRARSKELIKLLETLTASDIFWDKIASIKKVKGAKWVYDLSIPNCHNFIGNGIFVHNSNIVDSICFVLGKTSARMMRAERLTHLIYNGGKGNSPANFLEVSLVLENKERKLPFDSDNVTVTRRLTRNGTMSYKVNGQRSTRAQVLDLFSSAAFNMDGHNIVLQGDITSFIEMDPLQRRGIIDEISGIAEYDEKKEKAKKDLDTVEGRIKELVIVMSERKKHLQGLKKEKEDAEKYRTMKDEQSELEGRLAFTKLKQVERSESKFAEKLSKEEEAERELSKEFRDVDSKLDQKQKELKKIDEKLIKDGGKEQVGVKYEIERIRGKISISESKIESKQAEISRIDAMVSKLQDMDSRPTKHITVLKQDFEGIHGTVAELLSIDTKYASAVSTALGNRANFVVVDNENTALKCIKYLKENKLGRVTFLPLTKIKSKKTHEVKGKGIIGLAINLVEFDAKYREAISYALGDTHIVDTLDQVKSHIGKTRMVSLDGDIAEKSGAITGGFKKISKKGGGTNELEECVKSRDKLLDEIENLQLDIEGYKRELEDFLKKDEQVGSDMESMQRNREVLDLEIDKLRTKRDNIGTERDTVQRRISDLRVDKARIDAKLTDIRINMKKFKDQTFEEGDIEKMEERLVVVNQTIIKLEPVNMKAIDLYDTQKKEYDVFVDKFDKLQEERKSVIDFMEEIEEKKKEVFFKVFNKVSEEFQNIFPMLSPDGEARLFLEDMEDPLVGGMFVEAKPSGKKLLSIEAMSGGEKTITALAFLFALQRYKPAPFYVLDEVDAALDQANSMRLVKLLNETVKDAQLLVISHNNAVVKSADRVFGISMQADGTSKVVGMEFDKGKGA